MFRAAINNVTGGKTYVSSIDEVSSLVHSDPSISSKIDSIEYPLEEADLTAKSWGYRLVSDDEFSPIPKVSNPDTLFDFDMPYTINSTIEVGVKVGPGLAIGTYSKQILFSIVANYAPTSATFLPGPEFATKVRTVTGGGVVHKTGNSFKKASTAPTASNNAVVVSTSDPESPIQLWVDGAGDLLRWSEADTVYTNEDSSEMFAYAFMTPEKGTLDLSSFDTRSLDDPRGMFNYTKLKTIYASNKFVTSGITRPRNAFIYNTNLVGGNGTAYTSPNNGHTYMRIDKPGKPGYFTQKP